MTEKFKYTVVIYFYEYNNGFIKLAVETNDDVASNIADLSGENPLRFRGQRQGEEGEISDFVLRRGDVRMVEQYEN